MPHLVISIHASPAEQALVVNLDQLPFGPMAEVSKKSGEKIHKIGSFSQEAVKNSYL